MECIGELAQIPAGLQSDFPQNKDSNDPVTRVRIPPGLLQGNFHQNKDSNITDIYLSPIPGALQGDFH